MTPLRVFVVDDHPVMRKGISDVLASAGMKVAGTAGSVDEALGLLPGAPADVVLVDLHLGGGTGEDGIALIRALAGTARGPRCLVYSMREDAGAVSRCLATGALGYVTKSEVWETLTAAIREVSQGRRFLGPAATRALGRPASRAPGDEALSDREAEVFRMLGEGLSTAEIGACLHVSPRTVESYCARLIAKFDLAGMRDLRRRALAARSE